MYIKIKRTSIKPFQWSDEKNEVLKQQRGVCFEDVILGLENGQLIDVVPHLFILSIRDYTYYVPFVEDDEKVFLINIIPSRKYHKIYQKEK